MSIFQAVSNIAITEKKEKQRVWHAPGVFSDKVIDFTNEPSKWCSFVKNIVVDDGDIQLVTNSFDSNTYCTVSDGTFVYTFSF